MAYGARLERGLGETPHGFKSPILRPSPGRRTVAAVAAPGDRSPSAADALRRCGRSRGTGCAAARSARTGVSGIASSGNIATSGEAQRVARVADDRRQHRRGGDGGHVLHRVLHAERPPGPLAAGELGHRRVGQPVVGDGDDRAEAEPGDDEPRVRSPRRARSAPSARRSPPPAAASARSRLRTRSDHTPGQRSGRPRRRPGSANTSRPAAAGVPVPLRRRGTPSVNAATANCGTTSSALEPGGRGPASREPR